jgi:hypothetical protein
MFDPDGTFNDNHINNWQHAAMYLGYMVAGIVDVAAHFTDLPADCGQARPAATPAPCRCRRTNSFAHLLSSQ